VAEQLYKGYRVVPTDERLHTIGTRFTYRRAEALAEKYDPSFPAFRVEIEKVGLFRYEVVTYQNVLEKVPR
jgi:hypothetical protein